MRFLWGTGRTVNMYRTVRLRGRKDRNKLLPWGGILAHATGMAGT